MKTPQGDRRARKNQQTPLLRKRKRPLKTCMAMYVHFSAVLYEGERSSCFCEDKQSRENRKYEREDKQENVISFQKECVSSFLIWF